MAETLPEPTISIGPFKNDDGTYRVEVVVHGLRTEREACAAADHITQLLCSEEILLNG